MANLYGIELNELQEKQFALYYKMLVEYNEKCNLTAITEEKEVYLKHFYDSLCLKNIHELSDETLLDVGAGAGFPSIPLKILYPNLKVTIVDSLNKRIVFLEELCKLLNIQVTLVHARAEEYIENNREKFDIVTARAVARLNILAELCIPFVRVGGYFIVLKGSKGEEELVEAKSAISKLGASFDKKIMYYLPEDSGERYLIKYKKVKNCPKSYPRAFAKIKSKPL